MIISRDFSDFKEQRPFEHHPPPAAVTLKGSPTAILKLFEKDGNWEEKLIGSTAGGTEIGPVRPGHVIDPHDAVVVTVCHVDLSGWVHKDAM